MEERARAMIGGKSDLAASLSEQKPMLQDSNVLPVPVFHAEQKARRTLERDGAIKRSPSAGFGRALPGARIAKILAAGCVVSTNRWLEGFTR